MAKGDYGMSDINFQEYIVPTIMIAGLCVGYVMKQWLPMDNKFIPTVLLILGAISGAILFGADFKGIVSGALSCLASVGMHQVFKQLLKLPMGDDEYYAMGMGEQTEEYVDCQSAEPDEEGGEIDE